MENNVKITRRYSAIKDYFSESLIGLMKNVFTRQEHFIPKWLYDRFIDTEGLFPRENERVLDDNGLNMRTGKDGITYTTTDVPVRCNTKVPRLKRFTDDQYEEWLAYEGPTLCWDEESGEEMVRVRVFNNNQKIILMKNFIIQSFAKTEAVNGAEVTFATGTNRFVAICNNLVFKIAVDKEGCVDNYHEFVMSKDLQPHVAKCYETNGLICVSEYASVILDKKEAEGTYASQMQSAMNDLHENKGVKLSIDVGTTGKNISNWGLRKSKRPVIIDYGYVYKNVEVLDTLRCQHPECGAGLTHNKEHSGLICTNDNCPNKVDNEHKVYGSAELQLLLTTDVRMKMYKGTIDGIVKMEEAVSYFYDTTRGLVKIENPTEDQMEKCRLDTIEENYKKMVKLAELGDVESLEESLTELINSYGDTPSPIVARMVLDITRRWTQADYITKPCRDLVRLRQDFISLIEKTDSDSKKLDLIEFYIITLNEIKTVLSVKANVGYYEQKYPVVTSENLRRKVSNLMDEKGVDVKIYEPLVVDYELDRDSQDVLTQVIDEDFFKEYYNSFVNRILALPRPEEGIAMLAAEIRDREVSPHNSELTSYLLQNSVLSAVRELVFERVEDKLDELRDIADELATTIYNVGREHTYYREFLVEKQKSVIIEISKIIKKAGLGLVHYNLSVPIIYGKNVPDIKDVLKQSTGGIGVGVEYSQMPPEASSYVNEMYVSEVAKLEISNKLVYAYTNSEVRFSEICARIDENGKLVFVKPRALFDIAKNDITSQYQFASRLLDDTTEMYNKIIPNLERLSNKKAYVDLDTNLAILKSEEINEYQIEFDNWLQRRGLTRDEDIKRDTEFTTADDYMASIFPAEKIAAMKKYIELKANGGVYKSGMFDVDYQREKEKYMEGVNLSGDLLEEYGDAMRLRREEKSFSTTGDELMNPGILPGHFTVSDDGETANFQLEGINDLDELMALLSGNSPVVDAEFKEEDMEDEVSLMDKFMSAGNERRGDEFETQDEKDALYERQREICDNASQAERDQMMDMIVKGFNDIFGGEDI